MAASFDPWVNKKYGDRRRSLCKVIVAGKDVTDSMMPHLISVVVIDVDYGVDRATIELDDRDARLPIPKFGQPVQIYLGWESDVFEIVFQGSIKEVESRFDRKNSGRRLWIDCESRQPGGVAFSPRTQTWGEGQKPGGQQGQKIPLRIPFMASASAGGLSGLISPKLGAIERDFWTQQGESHYHFAQRIANEFGSRVKFSGQRSILYDKDTNLGAMIGGAFPGVVAEWGANLIGWKIKPYAAAAASWSGVNSQHFDEKQSKWIQSKLGIVAKGLGAAGLPMQSIAALPAPAPNAQVGQQQSQGQADSSETGSGTGWFSIQGEPTAKASAIITAKGCRPGVDGPYNMKEVQHRYDRNAGYITTIKVDQPGASQGGASS